MSYPLVEGWLTRPEAEVLHRCARDAPEGDIVEVGSYCGRSTIVMAYTGRTIHAIDPHNRAINEDRIPVGPSWERFNSNIRKHGVEDRVVVYRCLREQVLWSGPIGLLFIDADHDYVECKGDYEHFRPHLVPGALVAFHDYTNFDGVRRFVDELDLPRIERADSLVVLRCQIG